MDHKIIEAIRAEEAELLRKLAALRELLAVYGVTESPVAQREERAKPTPSAGREKVEITGFTESTRKSVVLALMAMATNSGLMKTRDLVQFIETMGHTITGNNKVNALGALLARSVDITSHGKAGWSLVDRDRALAIVQEYGPKENAPQEDDFSDLHGADAVSESVAPLELTEAHSNWGSDA